MNPKTLRALFDELDERRGFIASRSRKRAYDHADAWEKERAEAIELLRYSAEAQGDMTPEQWRERVEQWLAEAEE